MTAWHPKTDGQTEQINNVIEQYFCVFVNYLQDDWLDWLPLAKFVGNNTELKTTKVTLFFVNKSFHLHRGIKPIRLPTNVNKLNANKFAGQIKKIQNMLQRHLLLAQVNHKKYANCHKDTALQYRESNFVWLDTQNLFTKQPCQKLKNYCVRPYLIKKIDSAHAIQLVFPENICIHLVFYVNLFQLAATELLHADHIQPPSPSIEVDSETKWEVTAIVDSHYFSCAKKLQY